jgi:hypothetical protein
MFTHIFNNLSITPKYILAVRNPESVIASMKKQYNANESVSEVFWLTKNTEAIYHTGGNCFILHYEDWHTDKAPEIAKQLIQYTGLSEFWEKGKSVADAISKDVRPNLNRAVYNDYAIQNKYVLRLYEQLRQCRGTQFNRVALKEVVLECRRAMSGFSGWAIEAQRLFRQRGSESVNLERELERSVHEVNRYISQCKDLNDENENLLVALARQDEEAKEAKKKVKDLTQKSLNQEKIVKQLRKRNLTLETSTSFQVGRILVHAFKKPGKNTLMFPYYILQTILSSKTANNNAVRE